MTREQVIHWLEETKMGGQMLHDNTIVDASDMAIAALREQEQRRWIPVTERMPEQGERVLATDGGFVGELYVNSRVKWQRYNVNDSSLLMALDILWWMPLPEPPKEDE